MKKEFTTSVYILHEGCVLLLMHPKLDMWLPPGGHIEENESPTEAAKREVREETGLEITFIKQENIWVNRWNAASFERPYLCLTEEIPPFGDQAAHQHLDFIYLARPEGNTTPQGEDPLKWFTLGEVMEMKSDEEIFTETQEVIKNIFDESIINQQVHSSTTPP